MIKCILLAVQMIVDFEQVPILLQRSDAIAITIANGSTDYNWRLRSHCQKFSRQHNVTKEHMILFPCDMAAPVCYVLYIPTGLYIGRLSSQYRPGL